MSGDTNIPFKSWHAVQWVAFVIFILAFVSGIVIIILASQLSLPSGSTSLSGNFTGVNWSTFDSAVQVTQKLEYGSGGTILVCVGLAMLALFIPSKGGSSAILIVVNILACCGVVLVVIFAIVPTVEQLIVSGVCTVINACYSCVTTGGTCSSIPFPYTCWYDSTSYNSFCGTFSNLLLGSVIASWIGAVMLTFLSIFAIVIACTIQPSSNDSSVTIISQSAIAQPVAYAQPVYQQPGYPQQGYPQQGYAQPQQGYPPPQQGYQQPVPPPYNG